MPTSYSEDSLVEQPAIALFAKLGWQTANLFHEDVGPNGNSAISEGREADDEVVLVCRLRAAIERLNPSLPPEAYSAAIDELARDRSTMSSVAANRELYRLLKDGVKVNVRHEDGSETPEKLTVIDWNDPASNDFFLASQFWVFGGIYRRRADLVGFVNGIPVVFIELKAVHRRLEDAYKENLTDYKFTIPAIFWYNGFIILSNGSESRVGTLTSGWEHFSQWKKINSEGEQGIVSLETMIRGTCEPPRLLDILENFIIFSDEKSSTVKMVAKNHQYLGVNSTIEAVKKIKAVQGRLGVFWHTQGSGKSYSMVFFSQKVLRKLPGNWTFVVVTDRQDLDGQIYKNFANTGAVTEPEDRVRPANADHLRQLLREDHRYLFTLIQKFRPAEGEKDYPKLSDRSDIIVITDEAHRSQYDAFAYNMRSAVPNAAFIGFTGTPLLAGEEKTREVFGDYISIYHYKQSQLDKNTVPLFYENRIPEMQLTNEDLNDDMERIVEDAMLDEEQEKKLESEFGREYHIITRTERLETIAEDIVDHFIGRGFLGKAMVVSIDKATAIRMYDKVSRIWKERIGFLKSDLCDITNSEEAQRAQELIQFMEETDMAVVVSQSQNEVAEMAAKGLQILPHRKRMVNELLDTKFKDPNDRLRIVFVCAMWMTGFDVPSCSTIYLDKPMKNHTLMQTIARANRIFQEKEDGLIVDYIGVFRDLERALAIYNPAVSGGPADAGPPIQQKEVLLALLKEAIAQATAICTELDIDLEAIKASEGFETTRLIDMAVEAIIVNDETKAKFLTLAGNVIRTYQAILPHPAVSEFRDTCILLARIVEKILNLDPPVDISGVMKKVEELLDHSIAPQGFVIPPEVKEAGSAARIDLGQIDFEKLQREIEEKKKLRRTEIEKLKNAILRKLTVLMRRNRSRIDFQRKFQELLDEYNAGAYNAEEFFRRLVNFSMRLTAEEKRGISEGLSEEELAVFDILTRPDMKLGKRDSTKVKKVAKELLTRLHAEKFVLDWRKRQQSRADVRVTIEKTLDKLPDAFERDIYRQKCDLVYQHVYDSYFDRTSSVYTQLQ
ncbi:MAG: type I restriction endonuclease subunit R [bacterium]